MVDIHDDMGHRLPIVGLLLMAGCAAPRPPEIRPESPGYVVLLPGVESGAWQLADTVRGLRAAGIDDDIEIVEWGARPLQSLGNLIDLPANRHRAALIGAKIAAYRQDHPTSRVAIVGYSGGGGIALLAAESLPADVTLDRLVLVAAAVSPDYDLKTALARTRRLVNFHSPHDWFILGVGTSLFGTIDRRYTASAGHRGFDEHVVAKAADKLEQVRWTGEWRRWGHWGTHTGWLSEEWATYVLGPSLKAPETAASAASAASAP